MKVVEVSVLFKEISAKRLNIFTTPVSLDFTCFDLWFIYVSNIYCKKEVDWDAGFFIYRLAFFFVLVFASSVSTGFSSGLIFVRLLFTGLEVGGIIYVI